MKEYMAFIFHVDNVSGKTFFGAKSLSLLSFVYKYRGAETAVRSLRKKTDSFYAMSAVKLHLTEKVSKIGNPTFP